MITFATLHSLITQRESETLELKRSTAELKRAGETLCAFLNGEGGKVLIGVCPDGKFGDIEAVLGCFEPPACVKISRAGRLRHLGRLKKIRSLDYQTPFAADADGIGLSEIAGALTRPSEIWESVLPYLYPRYVKRRFDVATQIKRECNERGLPEPEILESFDEVEIGKNRRRRPIHFRRFRERQGLSQPDRLGGFWRMTFLQPVQGPLALGFACHFGLGLFVPVRGA